MPAICSSPPAGGQTPSWTWLLREPESNPDQCLVEQVATLADPTILPSLTSSEGKRSRWVKARVSISPRCGRGMHFSLLLSRTAMATEAQFG